MSDVEIGMRGCPVNSVIVVAELKGGDHELRQELAADVLATSAEVERVLLYDRVDGDAEFRSWLIAELEDARGAAEVAQMLKRRLHSVRSYHTIWRMARDATKRAHPVSTKLGSDGVAACLLTIFLPVPEGRNVEWNVWYDQEHMPDVLNIGDAIDLGHRLAPLDPDCPDEYLVLYEFPSRGEMDAFQNSGTPARKKREYLDRWGVVNVRRGFELADVIGRDRAMGAKTETAQ